MNSLLPQIGFDRFIQLDWAVTALRIRAGMAQLDDLNKVLTSTHAGLAAKKKTRTVLNRLWLEPRVDLVDFANRGVQIYQDKPDTPVSALVWGMAIATYPFFGRVAEIVGRLTALHGDCSSAEVHRRMAEIYGEREGTRRMTNMILQSQASWGAIERLQSGRKIKLNPQVLIIEPSVAGWLIESCLRYASRELSIASMQTHPSLYPYKLAGSLTYILSSMNSISLRSGGNGEQFASINIGS